MKSGSMKSGSMKSGSIIIVIVQRTFFDIIESQCSDIFETLNVFFGYNFKYYFV